MASTPVRVIDSSDEHPLKAPSPMVETLSGTVTVARFVQPLKVLGSMVSISGSVTVVRLSLFSNAPAGTGVSMPERSRFSRAPKLSTTVARVSGEISPSRAMSVMSTASSVLIELISSVFRVAPLTGTAKISTVGAASVTSMLNHPSSSGSIWWSPTFTLASMPPTRLRVLGVRRRVKRTVLFSATFSSTGAVGLK